MRKLTVISINSADGVHKNA